jgi:hypothetical protein
MEVVLQPMECLLCPLMPHYVRCHKNAQQGCRGWLHVDLAIASDEVVNDTPAVPLGAH